MDGSERISESPATLATNDSSVLFEIEIRSERHPDIRRISISARWFSLYRRAMSRDSRFALLAGALLAATGVALGAFGAHGLRSLLSPEALGWWQTAVQYQMWQAIGLVGIGAAPLARTRWSAALLAAGTFIFSGSLYLMALSGARWLGAVTPIGGVLMIAGWVCLAWSLASRRAD
jgi:uncharacterized membrane protein YgdD (TMEM256/DUF423 family)